MSKAFGVISNRLGEQSRDKQDNPPSSHPADSSKYQITPEIREVLDLAESSQGRIIFVTGAAGTGKSTLIDILRSETRKRLAVVAPTGVAAINNRGQTIHSFFQLPPGPQPRAREIRGAKGLVIKNMEILVIDEVSMVRADLMDAIADSLRINSKNHRTPFAAKTVILIGDMHQLPPIVATQNERRLFQERYDTPYFFSAEALKTVEPVTRMLTRSFRQQDQTFVDLLNNIRVGNDLENAIAVLNRHCYKRTDHAKSLLTLTTVNAKADRINQSELEAIDADALSFEAELEGDWGERDNQLPAPRILELKKGAQVMFLKNHAKWVNGTIGKIVALTRDSVRVQIGSGPFKGDVSVQKETWERVKYNWDDNEQRIVTTVVGSYTQLPFRLAWAVTIHKAQGVTLDSVTIDLDRGTFERGQAYVALSRCRTMEGISLSRPLRVDDIKLDKSIVEFYAHLGV